MKHGTDERIRVGIVSADPLRVLGVQAILEDEEETGEPRFEAVSLSAPKALGTSGLQVVLIDSGVTDHLLPLIESFRRDSPKLHLVVMGQGFAHQSIAAMMSAGARGYLHHSATEDEVRMALRAVCEGSMWASRKVLARLLDEASGRVAARGQPATGCSTAPPEIPLLFRMPKLTRRERDVLTLLKKGCPNREISSVLGVDEGTVKAHVSRLMRKMGVVNRTALTMLMLERRLC